MIQHPCLVRARVSEAGADHTRLSRRQRKPVAALCRVAALLSAVLGGFVTGSDAGADEGQVPFTVVPCRLGTLTPSVAARLQCGTVAVPRDRKAPASGTFRLAIVLIKSEAAARQADPVIYLAGGPGAPLTARAALIAEHEAEVVAPDRDLILVDQRGVGRSEPLLCPDLARQQLAIFAAGAERKVLLADWRRSYGLCRVQMADDGIRPEWFGSQVTADDIETVRQALRVSQWTLYAISSGTAAAMTVMARHPESIRAAVLDSVVPPDPAPMPLSQSFGRALDLLFAACRADTGCAAAHPDLEATFDAALRDLDTDPLPVSMPPGLGIDTIHLRAPVFRLIVDRLLYSRQGMAVLPSLIAAVRRRDPLAIQDVISHVAQGYAAMSVGAMAAVECRDRPSWRATAPFDEAPVSAFVPGMCDDWAALGPPPLIAPGTAVPTLLLSGEVDPITPPVFARAAAATMGARATVVDFAHVGHGVASSSPCAESIVTAFVRNPTGTIDATCASTIAPVSFR